jgi:hypothetical protein
MEIELVKRGHICHYTREYNPANRPGAALPNDNSTTTGCYYSLHRPIGYNSGRLDITPCPGNT